MDTIKELGTKGLIIVAGIALLVLGLAGQANIWGLIIPALSASARYVLAAVGVGLVAAGVVWEYLESGVRRDDSLKLPSQSAGNPRTLPALTATDFFTTVDDRRIVSFSERAANCRCVTIMARTIVTLANQYASVFERLAREGCEIQILIVDPASAAVSTMYGKTNAETSKRNSVSSLEIIRAMKNKYPAKIKLKYLSDAPTLGIIRFDKNDSEHCVLQIQLYLLHGAVGADRPLFSISKNDKWYNIFDQELTEIWNSYPEVTA